MIAQGKRRNEGREKGGQARRDLMEWNAGNTHTLPLTFAPTPPTWISSNMGGPKRAARHVPEQEGGPSGAALTLSPVWSCDTSKVRQPETWGVPEKQQEALSTRSPYPARTRQEQEGQPSRRHHCRQGHHRQLGPEDHPLEGRQSHGKPKPPRDWRRRWPRCPPRGTLQQ